jgi:hypothetical protein
VQLYATNAPRGALMPHPISWISDAHVRGTSVLTLSMRRLADLVAYSSLYEFEDVLQAVTGAERVEATGHQALEFSRRSYKYGRLLTGSRALAAKLAPAPATVRLQRDYDLFFPCFNHPHELYALSVLPDWQRRCRLKACYIVELRWHASAAGRARTWDWQPMCSSWPRTRSHPNARSRCAI